MHADTIIPVTLCVIFYALVIYLTLARGDAILNHWAARSGCKILQHNDAKRLGAVRKLVVRYFIGCGGSALG